MTFNEYQDEAMSTAIYPYKGADLGYPVLGLCGEAGEVAEHAKKVLRDDEGVITDARVDSMVKELGDVLWYVAAVAYELGVDLDYIANMNILKLKSRRERGVLSGSGSDR